MQKTLSDFVKTPVGILTIVILLLIGYMVVLNHRIIKAQEGILQVQLSNNQSLVNNLQALKVAQKDTLTIIKNNIIQQQIKKEEVQSEVNNTSSIDSVIANYFRYRPNNSN